MSPQHAEAIKQHYRTALALNGDPIAGGYMTQQEAINEMERLG